MKVKATHAAISSPQTTAFMATSLGMDISRDMMIDLIFFDDKM